MAIDLGVVSLVGAAIKLSRSVYEKGFNKEKSSRRFCYDTLVLANNELMLIGFSATLYRIWRRASSSALEPQHHRDHR
jgi:hypothetical protein